MYCRKSKGFSRILTTKLIHNIIPFITLVNISVGGYCRLDEQCQRSEHSAVCKDDRCVCKTGYILFNLKCHEGKKEILCYSRDGELIYFHCATYFLSNWTNYKSPFSSSDCDIKVQNLRVLHISQLHGL